jgi:hypothetical protein
LQAVSLLSDSFSAKLRGEGGGGGEGVGGRGRGKEGGDYYPLQRKKKQLSEGNRNENLKTNIILKVKRGILC